MKKSLASFRGAFASKCNTFDTFIEFFSEFVEIIFLQMVKQNSFPWLFIGGSVTLLTVSFIEVFMENPSKPQKPVNQFWRVVFHLFEY